MEGKVVLITLFALTTLVSTSPAYNARIVGGKNAPDGAYPHQVSIRRDQLGHICGGTIVHQEWVVTAASCVHRIPEAALTVIAGTNRLSSGGTKHKVFASYIHKKYNSDTYDNNVAILRVQHITFNSKTNKIPLEQSPVSANTYLTATGWGYTSSPPGSNPENLQQLAVKTISNQECKERLNRPVPLNQTCTFTRYGEGSCAGDTGGPITSPFNKLVGITQALNYPCGGGVPDTFVIARDYHQWFNQVCNCL